MKELFVLEGKAKINQKPYLVQTMELGIPIPIMIDSRTRTKKNDGRFLRYECLAIPLGKHGKPVLKQAKLIERHETKDEAIRQHKRLMQAIANGVKILGHDEQEF
ncbi:MAG: hypothetical protein ACI3WS_05395 [Phascolarctobacterium sp.]